MPAETVPDARVAIAASAPDGVLVDTGWEFHALDAPDQPKAAMLFHRDKLRVVFHSAVASLLPKVEAMDVRQQVFLALPC